MTNFTRIDFSKFKTQYATTEKQVKHTDGLKKSTALARAQAKDAKAKAARKAAAALRAREYNKARYGYLVPRYKAYLKWRKDEGGVVYTMEFVKKLAEFIQELGYDPNKFDQTTDHIYDWCTHLDLYARHRIKELS